MCHAVPSAKTPCNATTTEPYRNATHRFAAPTCVSHYPAVSTRLHDCAIEQPASQPASPLRSRPPHPSHTAAALIPLTPSRKRCLRASGAERDMRHATGLFRCPRRFVLRPSPPAPAAPRASSSLRSLAALSLPCSRLLSSRLWRLPHSP